LELARDSEEEALDIHKTRHVAITYWEESNIFIRVEILKLAGMIDVGIFQTRLHLGQLREAAAAAVNKLKFARKSASAAFTIYQRKNDDIKDWNTSTTPEKVEKMKRVPVKSLLPVKSFGIILFKENGVDKHHTLTFSHHTEDPLQLENLNVFNELGNERVDFIYCQNPKILKYLESPQTSETFNSISDYLLEIFQRHNSDIQKMVIKNPLDPNYRIFDRKKNVNPGKFHRDGARPGSLMINVWIALEDVDARPLAFIKMNGKPFPERFTTAFFPSFDPESEYVIVPKMKKGEMLIFYANLQSHGSPIILGNDGKRKSIAFFYK
jgi:hypothetical protein